MLAVFLTASALALASVPDEIDGAASAQSLVLFLGIFPIVNALFDYLSYGVTIALVRAEYRRKGLWVLGSGALDAVFAGMIFLALSAALVGIVALLNKLAGAPVIDLPALLAGLEKTPGQYWWVFGMIFSTLIPTLVHLGIGALSLLTLLPPAFRLRIESGIAGRAESGMAFQVAAVVTALVYTAYALIVTLGVWEAGRWLWSVRGPVLHCYLDRIEAWASFIGAV